MIVPHTACAQGRCMNVTTGCDGECQIKRMERESAASFIAVPTSEYKRTQAQLAAAEKLIDEIDDLSERCIVGWWHLLRGAIAAWREGRK